MAIMELLEFFSISNRHLQLLESLHTFIVKHTVIMVVAVSASFYNHLIAKVFLWKFIAYTYWCGKAEIAY